MNKTAYRLLAIEDSKNISDIICRVASESGFETFAVNGVGALAAYDNFKPHIIILDILMPDRDGIEIMEFLRDRKSTTRIVILSGSSDSYRSIAEKLGEAHGLLIEANMAKPFRVDEMRALLNKIRLSMDNEKAFLQSSSSGIR